MQNVRLIFPRANIENTENFTHDDEILYTNNIPDNKDRVAQ
jgi:hypothetical protein